MTMTLMQLGWLDSVTRALADSTVFISVILVIVFASVLVALYAWTRWRRARSRVHEVELDANRIQDHEIEGGELVRLDPPDIRGARFGMIGEVLSVWRYVTKRRKLLNKGYVQWYLLDDSFPTPRFVKPSGEGGGVPELKYDGTHYWFPKDVMLPDERQGLWTVMHRKGEADPIHLREPNELAVPTKVLTEYLQQRVSSSPPSWLSSLGLSPNEMIQYAIAGVIILALVGGFMNGGLGF